MSVCVLCLAGHVCSLQDNRRSSGGTPLLPKASSPMRQSGEQFSNRSINSNQWISIAGGASPVATAEPGRFINSVKSLRTSTNHSAGDLLDVQSIELK